MYLFNIPGCYKIFNIVILLIGIKNLINCQYMFFYFYPTPYKTTLLKNTGTIHSICIHLTNCNVAGDKPNPRDVHEISTFFRAILSLFHNSFPDTFLSLSFSLLTTS